MSMFPTLDGRASRDNGDRPPDATTRRATVLLVALTLALLAAWAVERAGRLADGRALDAALPHRGQEAGYVTSDRCQACHPSEYASWHASFHRTMTQPATPDTVVPPFDGVALASRGRTYNLRREGDAFFAEMTDPDIDNLVDLAQGSVRSLPAAPPRVERQVVMTTGSHHMQTYWVPSQLGRGLLNLPWIYLFDDQRWVPREDVFMQPPSNDRLIGRWHSNCVQCHSTRGVPGLAEDGLTHNTRAAELGIACEACHGPAAEHVARHANPVTRYRQHESDEPDPTIVNPEHLTSERASHVCGQCHGISLPDVEQWRAEGHVYKPGDDLNASRLVVLPGEGTDHPRLRAQLALSPDYLKQQFWSDGQVRVSGRDYNAMAASGCFTRGDLSCLSCHSMHASNPADQLAEGMGGDQACLQCHADVGKQLASHTRHAPGSAGSRCMSCHMPYTTYGLLKAIRSHTITSPTAAETLEHGRPNACNLCHLDQTLAWSADHLSSWYGQTRPDDLDETQRTIASGPAWALTGDAGQRALAAWHMGWAPAQAASGTAWMAPYLGHLLDDPYAAVRYVAQRALRTLPNHADLAYDYVGPVADRRAARQRVWDAWSGAARPFGHPEPAALLLTTDGAMRLDAFEDLARRRDDRPVFLAE